MRSYSDRGIPSALVSVAPHETAGDQRESLTQRISRSFLASQELLTMQLGLQLGLYQALADLGEATGPELAARTGVDGRYLAEWLEQQAVAGIVSVDDCGGAPDRRGYRLDAASQAALLDHDSVDYVAPLARIATVLARTIPQIQTAFATGVGVAAEAYGEDLGDHTAALNRPLFLRLLVGWLGAIAEIHGRLASDPPARVADVGCGPGWSSIALALAYPKVRVHGLDLDPHAISTARANAAGAAVGDRTAFETGDIAAPPWRGPFDLVTCFEALHDMAQPLAALRGMRSLLAEGGQVLIAEERVGQTFHAPGDHRERAAYGWSVLYCLPVGRSRTPSAATGAVLRPSRLAHFAAEAGFRDVTVAPIDDPVWRFYQLVA